MSSFVTRVSVSLVSASLLLACAEDSGTPVGEPVTLHFAAMVGDTPFACGEVFEGLGTTASTFEPLDFRMYLSAFEVRDAAGNWSALALDQNTPWQYEDVALLDFEDATGRCANGTPETRDIVTGLAEGAITGLRFDIGVPFALNHIDASTAPSPLNQTALFWNWLGGYKFVRLEGATTGLSSGWQFHLGSTGCVEGEGPGAQSCVNENRVRLEWDTFDPATEKVVFDVAALLVESNLDEHTPDTPRGCMSGAQDPDCVGIFQQVGLAHGGSTPETSAFVHVRPR